MAEYPIPSQSANLWRAAQQDTSAARNPGLIFDRLAPRWEGQGDSTAKKDGLLATAKALADPQLLQAMNSRWRTLTEAVRAERFSLATDWRFITGLGRKGPLEVGFAFNRYGFPIVPGSGLKGLARAYAELSGVAQADIFAVFGRAPEASEDPKVASTGRAIFFDAIPDAAQVPMLELDIMNPHYPKYYQKEKNAFPTNWQNPVPVYFLTVAAGTLFHFAVGWRGAPDDNLQSKAKQWLIAGLTEMGAGAKTSAGYGFFLTEEETPKRMVALAQRKAKRSGVPHYSQPVTVPPPEPQIVAPRPPKVQAISQVGDVVREGVVDYADRTGVWVKFTKWPNVTAVIRPDQLGGKQYKEGNQIRLEVLAVVNEKDGVLLECKPAPKTP